jgi:hypothetical protein
VVARRSQLEASYDTDVRRRVWASVIGIAAPIGLLAIAWTADRILHHADSEPAARNDVGPVADEPTASPDDIFEQIAAACSPATGVETCSPHPFAERFADRLLAREDRGALERRWLADLAKGDHVAAYGLAWLGSKRALPELRHQLLTDRTAAGGPISNADQAADAYADDLFPHHVAYVLAIKEISGQHLRRALKLSGIERGRLRREIVGCDRWRPALWLLHQIDDFPVPSPGWTAFKEGACKRAATSPICGSAG